MNNLIDINNSHSKLYGSKSINLAKLMEYGFNIPNGYVLSNEDILNLENLTLPTLNSSLYAIRSSAIGEDGKQNSFAGIFKSIINSEKENITENITEVFNSFFSKKAQVYTKLRNTSFIPSILIQEMIKSDLSMVAFIENNKYTISIQYGECNNIVSGKENSFEYEFYENEIKEYLELFLFKFNIDFSYFFNNLKILQEVFGLNLDIEMTYNQEEKKWFYLQLRPLII